MANTLSEIKRLTSTAEVTARLNNILGRRTPQFVASLTNIVAADASLAKCNPNSIMGAAFVAAAIDLPIDSNLGFAAIIPYKKRAKDQRTGQWVDVWLAQFQIMYRGFVQLAIRSGEYRKMNYSTVYADEIVSYNPITGETQFVEDFSQCTQRNEGNPENIVGYYAWFQLRCGFMKELFMTKADIQNHARKYSMSYRYDVENGRKSSPWSTNFDAMALKTVLKQLLSKWGILSIDMQRAIADDQTVYDVNGSGSYEDNKPQLRDGDPAEVVDAFEGMEQKPAELPTPMQKQSTPAAAPMPERVKESQKHTEEDFDAFEELFSGAQDDLFG